MGKDTSGPAFPSAASHSPHGEWLDGPHPGMTLRQWYAGQAMKGFIAGDNEASISFICERLGIDSLDYSPLEHWPQYVALWAWKFADVMLAHEQREAEGQG